MNWFQRAKSTLKARAAASRRQMAFEQLEPRWAMSHVAPGLVDAPQTYSGPLTGKVVFTSPGHGWQWSSGLGRYATDRPEYQLVEDFGTQDQMTLYADYLLRAGATVVPMRPVGRQINEVIVDNDSTGAAFSGSWSNSTAAQYYDEDYGAGVDSVSYRFASTDAAAETAVATYTPNLPAAGFYPVYTWVARSANRTTQLYRVNHTGGSTEITVDHRQVGYGWVYLGTYHFGSGSDAELGSVQISNNSSAGGVVIADAIRFGNGMGDFTDSGAPGPSGYPREDENSYKWIQRMLGVGTSSTTAIGSGTSNVSAPSNMARWMYDPNGAAFGGAVYVGIHSNGSTGDPNTATARGAVGLIDADAADRTPHQSDLALYLGRQINQDMQALPGVFEHNWSNRTTHTFTGQFGEIDLGGSAEMDATIIEVAFHDNIQDGALLRDPKARDQIARSMLHGTLEYFDVWGGLTTPTSLPTAPINVSAVSNASGEVTVNWAAGASTPASVNGAAATGFRVYASIDGYGFDGGTLVNGGGATSVTLTGYDPTKAYYFKVVAINDGGESKGSEVVTALPSGGDKQVLIVSGFDRFDRTQDFAYPYAYTGDGVVDRVWPRYNNSFDYVVQAQRAIQAAQPGLHVANASNEAVINGSVNLGDYEAVIWILGEESTANDTFNATEQTKVEQFIAGGGHLFVSGSEIGWDLDSQSGGVSFYENTLKGNFVSDDAGTYNANATAGGIFAGMSSLSFSQGNAFSSLDGQLYNVDSPDVIAPQAGAIAVLTYSNGSGTAAIQSQGTGGRGNVVMLAFPFEAITSEARRNDIMERVLDFFSVSTVSPAVDIKTRVEGLDADTPTGPTLPGGSNATFTYEVTNTGDVPLTNVVVTDDNGTPGSPGDDFNPTFTGGDTNSNSQLDLGETWTYSAVRTVVAGQFIGTGSVTSIYDSESVVDSDLAHYFGAVSGLAIQTLVAGDDADAPTGPVLEVGQSAIFNYEVTNTGNTPLSGVAVTDNNGTPGNASDDFAPDLVGGDSNANNLLDVGETWTYIAFRFAAPGQYAGAASVTASDVFSQPVEATDPTHFFVTFAQVAIEMQVNGDDADSAPGPSFAVGSSATLTYIVMNPGNVALNAVSVLDNNGTPLDAGDDFAPSFVGGDTNSNDLLDVGETWTYTSSASVVAGQQSRTATVVANNGELAEADSVNFVGVITQKADFNDDSIVDAADYVVWRKFSGTTVPAGTLGDADNDTDVDEDDYVAFNEQFGETLDGGGGSDEALAEPMTAGTSHTASQDAVFAALGSQAVMLPAPIVSASRRSALSAASFAREDWPAILAAISQRSALRDLDEPEAAGIPSTPRSKVAPELAGNSPVAHYRGFHRAKVAVGR
jgi:N-acetylmuramoyl-L-alanine amidase